MNHIHAEVAEVEVQQRWNLETAKAKGEAIAEAARVAPRVYDLLKMQRALKTLCTESRGPAVGRAVALEAALAPLPKDACAQVAIGLVCALREEHLRELSRGAVLVLWDAVSLAPYEAASASLYRLEEELARRGALVVHEVEGLTLVGDGVSAEGMALAMARLLQMHAHPVQRHSVAGLVVVVTAEADKLADDTLVLAHLRGCAKRTFGGVLGERLDVERGYCGMMRLEVERVLAAAPPVQSGARGILRDLARGLFSRPAPQRVPMALRLSVQSR